MGDVTTQPGSVVLIHGAWHGAWCWDGVVAELNAMGVPVTTVELPFSGFDDDVAAARSVIIASGENTVVCAHSGGGVTLSEAAAGLSNVTHLVYLAAFMVDEGEAIEELLAVAPTDLFDAVSFDGPYGSVDPSRARDLFYGDSEDVVVAAILPRLRPMHMGGASPGGRPAWKDVSTTFVVCANDHALAPEVQRAMAARAHEIVEWPTDHSPFLTRPRDVALLLRSYL
jgi:hypothetical protein